MTQETPSALFFPGQGLATKDIIACYQKLNGVDSKHVQQRLGQAQEAINKVHGTSAFDISGALKDEKSPSYGQTAFVQPVVYTLSILTSEITDRRGVARIAPSFVAGHSLGEYSALTRAGVIGFEEGIDLVTYRGQVMEEACQKTKSVLLRISRLTEDQVRDICNSRELGITQVALINAPTLIVVGCRVENAPKVDELAKGKGAGGASDLGTAGAFHTIFMKEPANKLESKLSGYSFKDPEVPVIVNLTGEPETSGLALKQNLPESMVKPVQWAKTLDTLRSKGVTIFGEVGPGNSLASLNKINGIEKTINVLNWFTPRSFFNP